VTLSLTRDQVRAIDRLAVERYHIPGLILMENAGRNAAQIIHERYGPAGRAFVICGTGNNGGDGCVVARHLHNAGLSVRLLVTGDEAKMSPEMAVNYKIARAMGIDLTTAIDEAAQARAVATVTSDDVVIDAILGTGFRGEVRSPLAELICGLNASHRRAVVAIDVPSGLDCDTGQASTSTVRADLTITFVAEKVGFDHPQARAHTGEVFVADIGAPRGLIDEVAQTRRTNHKR
jgi:NAD(P)H-hydrate epimerase